MFGAILVALAAFVVIFLKLAPASAPRDDSAAISADILSDAMRQMNDVRNGEEGRTFEFAMIGSPSARCFERINSVRPWRHPGWTNRALDQAKGILKFQYEVAGLALNCLMTEDKARFCKADERARMAGAVALYLRKYRRDIAAKNRERNVPQTAQGQMYKDLAERMNSMDPGAADDVGVDDPAQFFAGIESVTYAGFFTAADFGGNSAPELASHIRPPFSKPCG